MKSCHALDKRGIAGAGALSGTCVGKTCAYSEVELIEPRIDRLYSASTDASDILYKQTLNWLDDYGKFVREMLTGSIIFPKCLLRWTLLYQSWKQRLLALSSTEAN